MENIRNWDGKIVESCTWSLIGSSHRVWKIGVLTVMQPHEVEVILFQWKRDWKTLGRGHFCDILAKKKKQKTFVLGLCPEILSRSNKQTNKNIAWFVYFYAIDKYLFNLPISLFKLHSNRYTHPIPPSTVPHHWLPFISPGRVGTTWVSPNYGMSSLCRVRHILSNWCQTRQPS